MTAIYLLRHGTILPNPHNQFIGQQEIPLSEKGIKEAEFWQNELHNINFHKAWTSDLSRCRKTAEIVCKGRNLTIEEKKSFREINLGSWEGLTKAEVNAHFPGAVEERGKRMWDYTPKGGESFADVHNRAVPALQKCFSSLKTDECGLVVSHSGVIRVLMAWYLALDCRKSPQDLFLLPVPYAACCIIKL